jgi:F-box domain
LIFNRLNFHGHLRLSCVCRRFLQLIDSDVVFMRTVNFKPDLYELQSLLDNNSTTNVMHIFRTVTLLNYFSETSQFEWNVLENVENLYLNKCRFRDKIEIVALLNRCKRLRTVDIKEIEYNMIADYDCLEPIEKFQSPVSVVIDYPYKLLNVFQKILKVDFVRYYNHKEMERFLSQHAAIVCSLDIYYNVSAEFLQFLANTPELKLKHMEIYLFDLENKEQIAQIFARQRLCLTSLSTLGHTDHHLLDAIRFNLINLETLEIEVLCLDDVRLNDLKVLPRLKSVVVIFDQISGIYKFDIEELFSLEELKLKTPTTSYVQFKLAMTSPMLTLNKFELAIPVERKLLEQIVTLFPNLKSLLLELEVSFLAINTK